MHWTRHVVLCVTTLFSVVGAGMLYAEGRPFDASALLVMGAMVMYFVLGDGTGYLET